MSALIESALDPANAICDFIILAGDPWIHVIRAGQTFRIETHQVEERRKSSVSLMPAGLLKDFTAADYADLFAHLQTLNVAKTAATDGGKGE